MSPPDVAAFLGVDKRAVYRLAHGPLAPMVVRLGRSLYFSRTGLEALVGLRASVDGEREDR